MKPKILISGDVKAEYYFDAVNACGAYADSEYNAFPANEYDGLLLCGGCDIDPKHYGEKNNEAVNINSQRDEKEIMLAKAFIAARKPVFGICRGLQLINIVFGGSLIQNLPNGNMHKKTESGDNVHQISAVKGSFLCDIYGEDFSVNSAHHQAVKQLGEGLVVCACSGDVIEALIHKDLPVIGVQFHPERMCCSHRRSDTVDGGEIFKYFIGLCQKQVKS